MNPGSSQRFDLQPVEQGPAEPRNAASVVLVRDGPLPGPAALEVYLLRRHLDMAFAAGAAVFPGGGLDARDQQAGEYWHDHWVGPGPGQWADRLGVEPLVARSLVVAAVRETFEESGVLLAGASSNTAVADTSAADWERARLALVAGEISLVEVLADRGLRLRSDLLSPWSCWVTPADLPRRFRTWFFLAEVPAGQRTRDVSTESVEALWWSVRDALIAARDGRIEMWPPQYLTCGELAGAASTNDAFALARDRELSGAFPPARFAGDHAHLGDGGHVSGLIDRVRSAYGRP
ncbi:MAG: NUDIX hydrolase [Nocardioides sp.]